VLARERSDHGFSGESGGGHARRERLPQAGLRGSHRRWTARRSLSGRTRPRRHPNATSPPSGRSDSRRIHSGRIRLLLPSNAVVFTGTSGRIVGHSESPRAAEGSVPISRRHVNLTFIATEPQSVGDVHSLGRVSCSASVSIGPGRPGRRYYPRLGYGDFNSG